MQAKHRAVTESRRASSQISKQIASKANKDLNLEAGETEEDSL